MNDQPKSTPAGPFAEWENDSPFRETFLDHLAPEPAIAGAFRVVGSAVYEWLLDFEHMLDDDRPESGTRTDLRAAVADLRWIAGFLWHDIGETVGGENAHLAKLAPVWAVRLADFAADIEAALGRPRRQSPPA